MKQADSFYTSSAWRGLVATVRKKRGDRCEACGAVGKVHGDHIIEIKDGGPKLSATNVQLLCQACHNRKTANAKRERMA